MAVDTRAIEALDLTKLRLPKSLGVQRLEVQDYTDWTGEPSLRILAVIDDAVDVEHISGADVSEMKSAIHQSLLDHGITLFPYIFVAKPSELAEEDDED